MKGQLFIISAPSGAGKTSLVHQLIQRMRNLEVSVSHTTRPKRPGEVDGRDYIFVDRGHFESMIEADEFLEHASVFENYYGTSRATVEKTLASGKDVLLEIDWQGAALVKRKWSDSCSVFILPPSREALLERLTTRGQDSEDVIAHRTEKAVEEMLHYAAADYLIINDQFEVALHELISLVECNRLQLVRQQNRHKQLIASLLADHQEPQDGHE